MKILIKNGHVIDPANNIDEQKDIAVDNGRIVEASGFRPEQTIDAGSKIVCPGLIDMRVHLREPGQEHVTTIARESGAAVANGITTLCCTPDTDPVIDTPAVTELIHQRAENAGFANVLPIGAITPGLKGEQISEMVSLYEAGCFALSNVKPISNTQVMRRAMLYAATHDLPLLLNNIDPWLSEHGCAHDGAIASNLGIPGIPAAAECVAIARDLALIKETGVRAHFETLSTASATQMVGRARFDNQEVTAGVAAHQLFLTEDNISDFDSNCHVFPPLRSTEDRDALRQGIIDGVIGVICSDHQPHEEDAKLAPFCATEPGISGLDTLLPLVLKLADETGLPLAKIIACVTCNPADILDLPLGQLGTGAPADICIFDPETKWTLTEERMQSEGKNSPFLGETFRGEVTCTLVHGRVVYEKD